MVGGEEERAGRSEALFREVNENVAKLQASFDPDSSDPVPVVCECARTDCAKRFEMSPAEYARVRRHPHWFILARGHEQPSVEQVVETHDEYVIVEKQGTAALAADSGA